MRREADVHPHEFLHGWLRSLAPAAASRVGDGDRYRTLRALEAALATPASSIAALADSASAASNPSLRFVLLAVDGVTLAKRIAVRVRAIFEEGLADEAVAVWRRCADAPALTGLGFAEALAWRRGEATRAEAVDATIARTLRYAKRQRTWFRRLHGAASVDAYDVSAAADAIARLARETLKPA